MDECGRREDYALDRVSFNAFRYVPRLLEGFVGFPEPFLVEESNPFFQRLRLVNGLRRRIQEPTLTILNELSVRSLFRSASSFSLSANMLNLTALVPTRKRFALSREPRII